MSSTALVVYNNEIDSVPDLVSNAQTAIKYVGLVNQGATCYMNSLLQALFMTPEFRSTLYKWSYDASTDGPEELCVPRQLQKLFGMLQLSSKSALDTVALTKSFGWDNFEVFQQQDAQELSHVLFDILEDALKHTAFSNIINELYGGEMVDYIKCVDVNYQSERLDKFLDVSLAIQNEMGTSSTSQPTFQLAHGSARTLQQCFGLYLTPEVLDGDNQYLAGEPYNRKMDAIKGLKFTKLPRVLSIQLKRFVFDFSGYDITQKKINDQVKFPFVLNMNPYISRRNAVERNSSPGEEALGEALERRISFDTYVSSYIEELKQVRQRPATESAEENAVPATTSPPAATTTAEDAPYDDGSGLSERDIAAMIREEGPWVYELYAVLVHSGACGGGHYFAYVKDLETDTWYCFNDSSVRQVDLETVRSAWGQASTAITSPWSWGYSSYQRHNNSENAYLLVYHQIELDEATGTIRKVAYPSADEVPDYIRNLIEVEKREEMERKKEEERKANLVELRLRLPSKLRTVVDVQTYNPHAFPDTDNSVDSYLTSNRHHSFRQVLMDIVGAFDLLRLWLNEGVEGVSSAEDVVRRGLIRLRYNKALYGVAGMPVDIDDLDTQTLEHLRVYTLPLLWVEIRRDETVEWEPFRDNWLRIFVQGYDAQTDSFTEKLPVMIPFSCVVEEMRTAIASIDPLHIHVQQMRVFRLVTAAAEPWIFSTELTGNDTKLKQSVSSICYLGENSTFFYDDVARCTELVHDGGVDGFRSAESLFKRQYTRVTVKCTIAHADTTDLPVLPLSFSVNRSMKVKALRARVAELLNTSASFIHLYQSTVRSREITSDDHSVDYAFILPYYENTLSLVVNVLQDIPPGSVPVTLMLLEREANYVPGIVFTAEDYQRVMARVGGERGATPCVEMQPVAMATEDVDDACVPDLCVSVVGEALGQGGNCQSSSPPPYAVVTTSNDNEEAANRFLTQQVHYAWSEDLYHYVPMSPPLFLSDSMSVNECKQRVLRHLIDKHLVPESTDESRLRLRVKNRDPLTPFGPIWRLPNSSLANLHLFLLSETVVVAQLLDEPEDLSEQVDGVVLLLQQYHPSTRSLGPKFEVIPNSYQTVAELLQQLSGMTGIAWEHLKVLPISNCVTDYYVRTLHTQDWQDATTIGPRTFLNQLFHFSFDHMALLFQDASEPLRPLFSWEEEALNSINSFNKETYDFSGTGKVCCGTQVNDVGDYSWQYSALSTNVENVQSNVQSMGFSSNRSADSLSTTAVPFSWTRPVQTGIKIRKKNDSTEAKEDKGEAIAPGWNPPTPELD